MDTSKEVTLGGRVFVATSEADMTFDQFAWIQQATEKAGLGREMMDLVEPHITESLDKEVEMTNEIAENLTMQIVTRCYRGRAHLDVLAGILVEQGKTWSWENAEENRDFFGQMKGIPDIETANVIVAQAILGFFWSGLASSKTFQNSTLLPHVIEELDKRQMARMESGSAQENGWESFES